MKTICTNIEIIKTALVSFTRAELCDLLIACTMAKHQSNASKWGELHDNIKAAIAAIDETNAEAN